MYKFVCLVITITFALIFNACSLQSKSMVEERLYNLNKGNDKEMANSRLEQVVEYINSKNADGLKTLFSDKALNESGDFEKSAEKLFDFVQGEIISWDDSEELTVTDANDYGKKSKEIHSYYYVSTENQTYFFMLWDCPINTKDINEEGLYMLLVVKESDEADIWDESNKIIYDGNKKLSHAGIYIPIE